MYCTISSPGHTAVGDVRDLDCGIFFPRWLGNVRDLDCGIFFPRSPRSRLASWPAQVTQKPSGHMTCPGHPGAVWPSGRRERKENATTNAKRKKRKIRKNEGRFMFFVFLMQCALSKTQWAIYGWFLLKEKKDKNVKRQTVWWQRRTQTLEKQPSLKDDTSKLYFFL